MDNQVEKLKINVSNISNYLFKSNKELKNLKLQKKNLFSNIENKKILKSKENKLETKNLGIGSSVSKISDVVTSPIKNIFDKIFDFFGLIALGKLLQELPKIIKTIDEFFKSDFIKSIGDVMRIIGVGFKTLGDFIGILPESKRNELDKDLKEIEKESDDALRLSNESDREISGFDRDLKNNQNNNNNNNNNNNRSSNNTTQPISNNRQNYQPTSSASPMVPRRSSSNSTNNNSQTTPEKRLSRGGTILGNASPTSTPTQAYTPKNPRKSGQLKHAERGMSNGFEDFSSAVNNITQVSDRDAKNMLALADLSKNFRELNLFSNGNERRRITTPSPSLDHPTTQDNYGPSPSDSPTSGSLAYILPQGRPQFTSGYRTADRPGHRGVDIGVDGNSPVIATQDGKIIDFYSNFGDWGDAVVIKYNDGYTGIYGHVIRDPRLKIGDLIKRGQTIAKVKFWPKGVAGNTKYDDNSHLHYERKTSNGDWINPSPYLNSITPRPGAITPAQVIPLSGPGADPQLRGLTISPAGRGGDRRLNRISNGGGNQSVFVYAVQPVENYVPFPYPVPIQSPVIPTPITPTVPPIWRP